MKNYLLLIFYVAVSLLIGREFHPFSNYPMYNSFPNYGYVFYITNERDSLIPLGITFRGHKSAGYVGHMYCSFMNSKGYPGGEEKETPEQLQEAGKMLLNNLLESPYANAIQADTVKLYRRCYLLEKGKLINHNYLMYERAVKP